MIKNFKKIIITLVAFTCLACSGWSIMGYELNPKDYHVQHIFDQDSVFHVFELPISFSSENWCIKHGIWEKVEINE